MADYVELIKFIRTDKNMGDRACIVFGGSYGGMLAGWLRQKFPQTFQGALASSAPSLYFKGAPSAPMYAYAEISTQDFRSALAKSPELIQEAFTQLMTMTTRPSTWTESRPFL
jgi:lysosomal Pro-X carboxypeptidase